MTGWVATHAAKLRRDSTHVSDSTKAVIVTKRGPPVSTPNSPSQLGASMILTGGTSGFPDSTETATFPLVSTKRSRAESPCLKIVVSLAKRRQRIPAAIRDRAALEIPLKIARDTRTSTKSCRTDADLLESSGHREWDGALTTFDGARFSGPIARSCTPKHHHRSPPRQHPVSRGKRVPPDQTNHAAWREPRGQAGPKGGGAGRLGMRLVHARRFGVEPAAQIGGWPITPATRKACAFRISISSAAQQTPGAAYPDDSMGRSRIACATEGPPTGGAIGFRRRGCAHRARWSR